MKKISLLKYWGLAFLVALTFSCSKDKKQDKSIVPHQNEEQSNIQELSDIAADDDDSMNLTDINNDNSMNLTDINNDNDMDYDSIGSVLENDTPSFRREVVTENDYNAPIPGSKSKEATTIKMAKDFYCSDHYSFVHTLYNNGTLTKTELEHAKRKLANTEKVELTNVKDFVCNHSAFAALQNNGTVVVWGEKESGGDPNYEDRERTIAKANGDLTEIKKIVATDRAFAALTRNDSVITWGDVGVVRDPSFSGFWVVRAKGTLTEDVEDIVATEGAFAALKKGGTVITWGNYYFDPGYSDEHRKKANGDLVGITKIVATEGAFAALKKDENGNKSVVVWGERKTGGDPSYSPIDYEDEFFDVALDGSLDKNIDDIFSNRKAFAVRKTNGKIIAWGPMSATQALEKQINLLYPTNLKNNSTTNKNDPNSTKDQIEKIKEISGYTLWSDETITITGKADYDWQFRKISDEHRKLKNVKDFISTKLASNNDLAFAALIEDTNGNTSVVTWGNKNNGGDPTFSSVTTHAANKPLTNVKKIFSTHAAFAAVIDDGNGKQSLVTWGDIRFGGDFYTSYKDVYNSNKIHQDVSLTGLQIDYVKSNYASFRVYITGHSSYSALGWGNAKYTRHLGFWDYLVNSDTITADYRLR